MTHDPTDIVRNLADVQSTFPHEYRVYCSLCSGHSEDQRDEWLLEVEEHEPTCPWRQAVEYTEDDQ